MEKFTSPWQPEQPQSLNPRAAPYSTTTESNSRVPPSTRVFSNMPTRELFTRSPEQLAEPSRAKPEPPEVISDISKQVHDALLESRDMHLSAAGTSPYSWSEYNTQSTCCCSDCNNVTYSNQYCDLCGPCGDQLHKCECHNECDGFYCGHTVECECNNCYRFTFHWYSTVPSVWSL